MAEEMQNVQSMQAVSNCLSETFRVLKLNFGNDVARKHVATRLLISQLCFLADVSQPDVGFYEQHLKSKKQ